MWFASFQSGGFITAIVVNPPERKQTKRISVQCPPFLVELLSNVSQTFKTYQVFDIPKTQNNLNSHLSQYIGMCLVWPPLKTIYYFSPYDSFWKGQSLFKNNEIHSVVFSIANHKSAISYILMFGSSHEAKSNLFSFFYEFWCDPKKIFRARSRLAYVTLCSCWSPSKVCGTLYLG